MIFRNSCELCWCDNEIAVTSLNGDLSLHESQTERLTKERTGKGTQAPRLDGPAVWLSVQHKLTGWWVQPETCSPPRRALRWTGGIWLGTKPLTLGSVCVCTLETGARSGSPHPKPRGRLPTEAHSRGHRVAWILLLALTPNLQLPRHPLTSGAGSPKLEFLPEPLPPDCLDGVFWRKSEIL